MKGFLREFWRALTRSRLDPTYPRYSRDVRIYINRNVRMSPGKMAAQAVHAALNAHGIEHGRVIVLMGSPARINALPIQIRDAGYTELAPGTLTAGAELL